MNAWYRMKHAPVWNDFTFVWISDNQTKFSWRLYGNLCLSYVPKVNLSSETKSGWCIHILAAKAHTWNNCMELYGLFNIDLNHKMTVFKPVWPLSQSFLQFRRIRPLIDPHFKTPDGDSDPMRLTRFKKSLVDLLPLIKIMPLRLKTIKNLASNHRLCN